MQSSPPPAASRSFAAFGYPAFRAQFSTFVLAMMADNIEHVISYWMVFQKFQSPALGGFAVRARSIDPDLASAAQVQGALEHWQQALVTLGFLDPGAPRKLMPRLNQLVNRARLTTDEVNILRGIARAMQDCAADREPAPKR